METVGIVPDWLVSHIEIRVGPSLRVPYGIGHQTLPTSPGWAGIVPEWLVSHIEICVGPSLRVPYGIGYQTLPTLPRSTPLNMLSRST